MMSLCDAARSIIDYTVSGGVLRVVLELQKCCTTPGQDHNMLLIFASILHLIMPMCGCFGVSYVMITVSLSNSSSLMSSDVGTSREARLGGGFGTADLTSSRKREIS